MTGYEGPQIPHGGENSKSWTHPDILDAFKTLDPRDAFIQADRYWQVRNDWEQGLRTFARSINNSISHAWEGPAAEASKTAIQKYTKDSEALIQSLTEMYTWVHHAANQISETKKAIPNDPVIIDWTYHINPFSWGLEEKRNRNTEEAREAMDQKYVKPFQEYDNKIPVLPTPVSPTHSVDISVPPTGWSNSGPGGPGPGGSPGRGDGGATGNPDGTQPQQTGDQPGKVEPQSTGDGGVTSGKQTQPTTNSGTQAGSDATKTSPTGTTPTPTGTPEGPGIPGGRPGGPGSPGTAGRPSTPGAPIPVPRQSISGLAASPLAGNPAAAKAGATGMPGGMAPGAAGKGKGEEDSQHKIPDYLITQENTDELLGEIPKTLPEGVIGTNPEFRDS
ncbi:hypothetical protein D5S18_28985 [Nocardia panacis]|uniref:PPE domain-containing protein n=1 Tax=Nocardia panacis TaxID=2340916 RepID=A0A3A4K982_9NOCA|nr:hypothetical protein [Nocardia panacis]RJO69924.1 hypothetical protein D5S18_28985 [Nocardia panacis]